LSPIRGRRETLKRTIQEEPPAVTHDLPHLLARLRGLFEIAALPTRLDDRESVLEEIARVIGESLGYGTVAINLLRPAWDDFEVVAVHGDERAKEALLGETTTAAGWEPLLTERFYARGAYLVPGDAIDWDELEQAAYVPEAVENSEWRPDDALFVPMRGAEGRLIGVLSVDQPAGGRMPREADLDALVAVAAYAARAVESAEMAANEARRRHGLELLLEVSAKLAGSGTTQEILDLVCAGIRDALGFELVVIELADHETDRYLQLAAVGFAPEHGDAQLEVPIETLEAIFEPQYEQEGCFLLSREEALSRVGVEPSTFQSTLNGTSPRAWKRHWLVVPLTSPEGDRFGFIWADDPRDRLLPSRATLQALRTFANHAATAIEAAKRRAALERRTAELEALHETTLALLQRDDPQELLEAIVARAQELLGTPHGFLCLVNPELDELELIVGNGHFAARAGATLARGEGMSGRIWATGEPLIVDDYDGWSGRSAKVGEFGFGAGAGVPLRAGSEVIGVLGVGRVDTPRSITASEQELLVRFGQLASLVLEQSQLARKVEDERDYSERLIEGANVLIVGIDDEGQLEVFNAEAARVTGYAPADVLGRSASELLPPFEGMLPDAHEGPIRTKDGEERLISWRSRAVVVDGKARGTISFGLDVTARRVLEEELRQSQKMEAVGRLAGGVAHDFNNLLTAISGYGELALEQLQAGSRVREQVYEMKRAAERAAGLTRQLLAFSRRQVLQTEVVDLNAIVVDLERMLGRLLGAQVELSTDLDARLGRTQADPGQLEQVVMNLALNARDAMPGGGRLTISTRNTSVDGESFVVLEVSDTGYGMDTATLEQAFEPFFTTKPAGEGTGLGLSTVYGIVKQSGGDVSAASAPGRGTTVRVLLPQVAADVTAEDEATAAPARCGGSTVLLVEDEDVVRRLVATMLRESGYRVLETENAEAAIARADGEVQIDILLTDVVMPGLSGPDLASLLVELRPELRVIFMSGYTADMVARNGELDPATAFVQKPFTRAELLRALEDLGGARLVA
jgi:PAS domain S-box-containing protein